MLKIEYIWINFKKITTFFRIAIKKNYVLLYFTMMKCGHHLKDQSASIGASSQAKST